MLTFPTKESRSHYHKYRLTSIQVIKVNVNVNVNVNATSYLTPVFSNDLGISLSYLFTP